MNMRNNNSTILTIHNFGPINNAQIIVNKYNIFIGHTSSGKSVAAKLITIFNDIELWNLKSGDFNAFIGILKKYNIDYKFHDDTRIEFSNHRYTWNISNGVFSTDYDREKINKIIDERTNELLNTLSNDNEMALLVKNAVNHIIEKSSKNGNENNDDESFVKDFTKYYFHNVLYNKKTPIYIPAERILISMFTNNIFSLIAAGVNIPECIKRFGSLYEKAKYAKVKDLVNNDCVYDIDFMDIRVSFDENKDTVQMKQSQDVIELTQASSGIQSIVPLWVVVNYITKYKDDQIVVLEEPELNLFPTMQVSLIEWLVKKIQSSSNTLVLTTHSPYILSEIDNLILAKDLLNKGNNRTKIKNKIKRLVSLDSLIDFDEVSSYFFDSSTGVVKDILNRELRTTGAENIDEASNITGYIFDELCNIERNEL